MHKNCYSCRYKRRHWTEKPCNGCSGVRNYKASLWQWFKSKFGGLKPVIQKKKVYDGMAQDRYNVTLLGDKWPADKELIKLCDKDALDGYVGQKTDRFCVVTVYKD